MRKAKFTEVQIRSALEEYGTGRRVEDICGDLGINKRTFYNWNKKYGNSESECFKQIKELKERYNNLQKMYAELAADHIILKDVITKKL